MATLTRISWLDGSPHVTRDGPDGARVTRTGWMRPASPSTDTDRELLLPGVWIHYTKQWVSASEVVDCYSEAPLPNLEDSDHIERTLASLYPSWHAKAACLGADEERFFGKKDTTERPALSMAEVAEAQAVCARCPVFEQCLTDALENRNEYGIWGGTSGRTRRRIWDAVDAGLTTVAEVVNAYVNGIGERYDRSVPPQVVRRTA